MFFTSRCYPTYTTSHYTITIGTITVWDRDQALVWFELKGRSNRISSVQFDKTRLVSDGTYSLVVVHDFDVPYGSSDDQFQYDVEYAESADESSSTGASEDRDSNESASDDNKDDNNNDDDDGNYGIPSATS